MEPQQKQELVECSIVRQQQEVCSSSLQDQDGCVTLCFHRSEQENDAKSDDDERSSLLNLSVPCRSLAKSDFFQAKLSDRWCSRKNSDNTIKIDVGLSADLSAYLKCVKFLASGGSGGLQLQSVDEALGVLHVGCEWLVDDCIQQCLGYLGAVRWTMADEISIRHVLSSLQVVPSQNLSLRIAHSGCGPGCVHVTMLEKTLTDLINLCFWDNKQKQNQQSDNDSLVLMLGKMVAACFAEEESGAEVGELCREILVKSFRKAMASRNWKAMEWILRAGHEWDAELRGRATEIYVAEGNVTRLDWYMNFHAQSQAFAEFHCGIFRCLAQGKAPATGTAARFQILRRCVDPLVDIIGQSGGLSNSMLTETTRWAMEAAQTLPLPEQSEIFSFFKNVSIPQQNDVFCATVEWWVQEILASHRSPALISISDPAPV